MVSSPSTTLSDWCQEAFTEPTEDHLPAYQVWEVESSSVGQCSNPHYLLSVRHKTGKCSRVLLTTCDSARVTQVEAAARRALNAMTAGEFAELFQMPLVTAQRSRTENQFATSSNPARHLG